jgi:GT2 family glycosyltransferase
MGFSKRCTADSEMRILGHIHTFNDEDVIDRSLGALLDQTYPLDEVLIVDNASTDSTLERSFPNNVTVIRHPENRGTSGAVVTGFQYAIDKEYDWIWVFDADSAPRKDALEKLVRLYLGFAPEIQTQTRLLASIAAPADSNRTKVLEGYGMRDIVPGPSRDYYEFDLGNWSGCLFKVEDIKRIGLPNADYVLDYGELEYGYRGKRLGLRAFMHQSSILDHDIGGPAVRWIIHSIGPLSYSVFLIPPIRCYYSVRNWIYFWLYEYHLLSFTQSSWWPRWIIGNFLRSPIRYRLQLWASLRGLWDGLFKNMHHRY